MRVIAFCATGRSGLGHLRRLSHIAHSLRTLDPELQLELWTNARPEGLGEQAFAPFTRVESLPRENMATTLVRSSRAATVVVDTAILPGLEAVSARLCLVLREVVPDHLEAFRLAEGRRWNLVLVPNPCDEWLPGAENLAADRVEAVGWVHDASVHAPVPRAAPAGERILRFGSGGGGNAETARLFARTADALARGVRKSLDLPVTVEQLLGPRVPEIGHMREADRFIHAGASYRDLLSGADLVVSTAGYNSVLELAQLETPTLFLPIPRRFDDQLRRARTWAPRLGYIHDDTAKAQSVAWMIKILRGRSRRAPWPLGPSGSGRAALLLREVAA